MHNAIQAEGLVKRFGDTRALNGVDLQVAPGTILGLLGPNGAGKTTIVRILATLARADGGRATVDGFDVSTHAHQVRQRIGLTGQYASVDDKLTGHENLLLIGRLLGLSRAAARQRAHELLDDFQLVDAGNRAVQTYSGGMRRRLDLAASLVGRPPLLFLDEPTTGLDPRARLELWELIRRLVAQGTTVLLTTQYLEEADQLADDIVVIDHGEVIAAGTPEALKARIGTRTIVVDAVNDSDVPAIRETLERLIGAVAQVDGLRVSCPADDGRLLPQVVRALDHAGIPISELMLRSASLDDVFLSLTGRHVEVEENSDPTDRREES